MKTRLFLILLVISITIPATSFAEQASGKPAWEIGSDKVCGDRLCSEESDILDNTFPIVYQIPITVFDKRVYTWGDKVNIQVVSPIDNHDPNVIDNLTSASATFPFRIHTNPEFSTLKNYILVETGPDTGIFKISFMIVQP